MGWHELQRIHRQSQGRIGNYSIGAAGAAADHEVLGIDDCEQVSNIFAYNPATGDRITNDEVEWTVSDPTVVTYDPVNGAVSSASRKNKGASIAMRGSSFGVK